jgi:hypothetical protein
MLRDSICGFVIAALLSVALAGANAFDESKYPSWKGQWTRIGGAGSYDPTKPPGPPQEPPLTAEYRAIWEANIAEGRAGGQYYNPPVRCIPHGMPRMMMAFEPMEIIIVPDVTYIYMSLYSGFRRIYTDGRVFPKDDVPSFAGYSIGKWTDADGDGRYDVLEVETRNLNGPRLFDSSGIPLHKDNMTVIRERIFQDKNDPNILRDEITTIDNALTKPWVITRSYSKAVEPLWVETTCGENNNYLFIEGQTYLIGADGKLMPSRRGQQPPDTRHFEAPK